MPNDVDRFLSHVHASTPDPSETWQTVQDACHTLPQLIDQILTRRSILATEANRYEIARSLDDASKIKALGRVPRWEYHPTSEQLQTRNGSDTVYLYLYWSRRRHSREYNSPSGQRKTYIGSKPAAIALARQLNANLTRYEKLQDAIRDHSFNLRHTVSALTQALDRARKLDSSTLAAVNTHCKESTNA